MSYTHFRGVSTTLDGYAVGAKGSEIPVISLTGALYQLGTVVTAAATELNILTGATVTAAEVNTLDRSANIQTIIAAGPITLGLDTIKLALVGAGAVTLAAPTAAEAGKIKVIEMTVDNGDVTLSLANVVGGTAGTTCTWSAVGQSLVLIGAVAKWAVVSEGGAALT